MNYQYIVAVPADMSKKRNIYNELPFTIIDSATDGDENSNHWRYVQIGPKKYNLFERYRTYGLDIYNFGARQDDVYLMGFPRSGTTLQSEMTWLIGNDLNYKEATKDFLDYRFPHIDFCLLGTVERVERAVAKIKEPNDDLKEVAEKYGELTLERLARRKGRRFIKSHLPISLMPPHVFDVGAKVIYCARNPKDVIVSLFKATILFSNMDINAEHSFKKYFEKIKNDTALFCPYFEHVKEAWAKRHDENFLFLFYEDTIKDIRQTITKVGNFLGKELSNDQIECLEQHLSFDKFKNNQSVNLDQLYKIGLINKNEEFIREGKSGGWRNYFVGDLEKEVDEWIQKNLEDTDLKFPNL